jgi:hypothetical protein
MSFLKNKVVFFLFFLCFSIHAARLPEDFPQCNLRSTNEIPQKNSEIIRFLETFPAGKDFLSECFPAGLPTTGAGYRTQNPKIVYETWYRQFHAVSAVAAAQLEEETKKREAAEELARQESQQRFTLQRALSTERKQKVAAEYEALQAKQQLVATGQDLQLARLDGIVSKNIPLAVATQVQTLLQNPDRKNHAFLFDDATHTVKLTVELKDGSLIDQQFPFSAAEYPIVVDGFKALAQHYQLLQSVFGGPQRSAYQIHLTPRPAPSPDEPAAITSSVDAYYYAVDAANKCTQEFKKMEFHMAVVNKWALQELPAAADSRALLALMLDPSHDFYQSAAALSVDLVQLEDILRKNPRGDAVQIVTDALELANLRFAATQKFSKDIFSLYCEVGEEYIQVLKKLTDKFGVIYDPIVVEPYINAIKEDIKDAQEKRRQAAALFYGECVADPQVQAAQAQMQQDFEDSMNLFRLDISPHVNVSMSETAMNQGLTTSRRSQRKMSLASVIPLFLNSPRLLFIYASNLTQLEAFFTLKSTSSIQNSRLELFNEELKYLTADEKKSLFIYISDLVNNFDTLVQEYMDITLSKKYLNQQTISDEKAALENLLNKIKLSLDNPVSQRKNPYVLRPLVIFYSIVDELRNFGPGKIGHDIRLRILEEFLDQPNPLKEFLLGTKIPSRDALDGYLEEADYTARTNEDILKQCWDYLHAGHRAIDIMKTAVPSDVDNEIRILQQGKSIVESNQRIIDGEQYDHTKSGGVITDLTRGITSIENDIQVYMTNYGVVDFASLPEPFMTYYNFVQSTRQDLTLKVKVDPSGQQYLWQSDARKFKDLLRDEIASIIDALRHPQKSKIKLEGQIQKIREALKAPNRLPKGSYNPLLAGSYNTTLSDAEVILSGLGSPLTLSDLPVIYEQKEKIEKLMQKFNLK